MRQKVKIRWWHGRTLRGNCVQGW